MASSETPRIVQIKITLLDVEPPVWRRVQIPEDFPLHRLHDVIQAVMLWQDCHLHQFEVGDRIYGPPELGDDPVLGDRIFSERNTRLSTLIGRDIRQFLYTYDFGDQWDHAIEIEDILEPKPGIEYPILVDGRGRCPPDDSGGPAGFAEFLEAMTNEEHPDHEHILDWYGEPFDPEDMEPEKVEAMLSRIRGMRRQGARKGVKKGTRRSSGG